MKKIILRTPKFFAIVDDQDFDKISQYAWRKRGAYAITGSKRGQNILMHDLIMIGRNPGKGTRVDHRNHCGLDNTRENLTICTPAENSRNRGVGKNNTSGYVGVTKRGLHRFTAQVSVDGIYHHIGTYKTAKQAAIARNEEVLKHHGKFAYLNKIR